MLDTQTNLLMPYWHFKSILIDKNYIKLIFNCQLANFDHNAPIISLVYHKYDVI